MGVKYFCEVCNHEISNQGLINGCTFYRIQVGTHIITLNTLNVRDMDLPSHVYGPGLVCEDCIKQVITPVQED